MFLGDGLQGTWKGVKAALGVPNTCRAELEIIDQDKKKKVGAS